MKQRTNIQRAKDSARQKQYYNDNKEKILSRQKKYEEKNRERKRAREKARYHNTAAEIKAKGKEYRDNNKEREFLRHRRYQLMRNYGISAEEYDTLFVSQGGVCAICGKHQRELPEKLCVDHDHQTNKVRGLLCRKCNLMIGNADEDEKNLLAGINYLQQNLHMSTPSLIFAPDEHHRKNSPE